MYIYNIQRNINAHISVNMILYFPWLYVSVKRKLSDSKMVPLSFTGWIELNLRGAVASWKTTTRNHGIVITVEDQEGNALRTDAFIQKHDCSNLCKLSKDEIM